jgi:hypothetical protein
MSEKCLKWRRFVTDYGPPFLNRIRVELKTSPAFAFSRSEKKQRRRIIHVNI